jgi:predicted alpha/beta-hydrolase family hydrolase
MRLEVQTPTGLAWIDLDRPSGKPVALLAIGHGAGGGVDARDILAVRDAALTARVAVARITQPYRVAGRRSPAPAPRLDEAWLAAVAALRGQRGLRSPPLVAAGRSSGARVACRTATASGAAAVVALAFPVHPPGKPEKTRLDELDAVEVPVLVVQGESDPFGMPEPRPPLREVAVIAGDHGLKKDRPALAQAVRRWLSANRA